MTGSPTSPPLRRWQPARGTTAPEAGQPSFLTMIGRGARNRCPVCGEGHIFQGFLKLSPACEHCGTAWGHLRADDAPPYIVIFLVGHILVPPIFWVEKAWMPPMWLHMVVWLPLFAIVSTLALRPVKGAVLAWMLRLGPIGDEAQVLPPSRTAAGDD